MGVFNQVLTAAACAFSSFLMGLLNVWPSYTLSLYTAPNNTILSRPMSDLECSLLGSIPSLGAMAGTALSGIILDTLGRKRGGIVLTLPFILCWCVIEVSSSSIPILIARFFGGASGGAGLVYAPLFISEVADDSIRGALASVPVTFYVIGALCSYLLGWFSTYHTIVWLNLAASIFGVVLLALIEESPVFLLRQHREEDARVAIAHYRDASPTSKQVLDELSRLKQLIIPAVELITVTRPDSEQKIEEAEKEKLTNDNVAKIEKVKMPVWKTLYVSPSSRRAFIVVGITLTLQVAMGIVPVQVYAKVLFATAAPNLSSHLCSVLFALVLLSGSIITGAIADKAGRRILIISSSVMVAICMTTLGFLLQTEMAPAWVTALVVLVYCFFFNIGAGTVPYVLLAEAFIPEVQGFASIVLVEWVWFLNFFIIGVFPFLSKLIGIHGVFYIFACAAVTNTIASYLMVPETKGLSNEQIQEAFLRSKKK